MLNMRGNMREKIIIKLCTFPEVFISNLERSLINIFMIKREIL